MCPEVATPFPYSGSRGDTSLKFPYRLEPGTAGVPKVASAPVPVDGCGTPGCAYASGNTKLLVSMPRALTEVKASSSEKPEG